MPNADLKELEKFSRIAHRWWDSGSEFKPLHEINPLRLEWIERHIQIQGKAMLDVGCGGGILSESIARRGATVTGIDLSERIISVARLHLLESSLNVNYRHIPVEELARQSPESFDAITCLEMLEHVPDPKSIISACAKLIRPGGHIFFSTINRNIKAFLFAVVGAEYCLGLLPKGIHDYARFIRPSELMRWARESDLEPDESVGLTYNPLTQAYRLGSNTSVNYLLHAIRALS